MSTAVRYARKATELVEHSMSTEQCAICKKPLGYWDDFYVNCSAMCSKIHQPLWHFIGQETCIPERVAESDDVR
jgi:endogenous inhibitor of DNA gyrase (YacG/DUF329 family)